jgi:hypothetical protein
VRIRIRGRPNRKSQARETHRERRSSHIAVTIETVMRSKEMEGAQFAAATVASLGNDD